MILSLGSQKQRRNSAPTVESRPGNACLGTTFAFLGMRVLFGNACSVKTCTGSVEKTGCSQACLPGAEQKTVIFDQENDHPYLKLPLPSLLAIFLVGEKRALSKRAPVFFFARAVYFPFLSVEETEANLNKLK